jgi:hypothetical protein
VNEKMQTQEGLTKKYTFSGSVYFDSMKKKNLYITNVEEIKKKVTQTNMKGIFAKQ